MNERYRIVNRRKRWAVMAADLGGRILTAPARLLKRPPAFDPSKVRSILVIRTAYIGDVIMTLPMLAPLKRLCPDARLTFLTAPASASLLRGHPHVDEVLEYSPHWFYPTPRSDYHEFKRELRNRSFDLVIEARADIRDIALLMRPLEATYKVSYAVGGGGFLLTHVVPHPRINHRVEYHLDIARFLGAEVDPMNPEWGLEPTREEAAAVDEALERAGVRRPFFCIHPGSRAPLKQWETSKYAALADALVERTAMDCVLLGAPAESDYVKEIISRMRAPAHDLAGAFDLRRLMALFTRTRLLVCNDSAPMHLAAAMATPTVALFGPSKPDQTGPWNPEAEVVARPFPCRPACDETTCTWPEYNACMRSIEVDEVLAACLRLTDRS